MYKPVAALSVLNGVGDVHLHVAASIPHRVCRVVGCGIVGIARCRKQPYRSVLVAHDVALVLREYAYHRTHLLTHPIGHT